jgi:hypothetical protein
MTRRVTRRTLLAAGVGSACAALAGCTRERGVTFSLTFDTLSARRDTRPLLDFDAYELSAGARAVLRQCAEDGEYAQTVRGRSALVTGFDSVIRRVCDVVDGYCADPMQATPVRFDARFERSLYAATLLASGGGP